jgi:hypothetical protein
VSKMGDHAIDVLNRSLDSCETCRFWQKAKSNSGMCRKRAPQGSRAQAGMTLFPVTLDADWCGEYESDPLEFAETDIGKFHEYDN